MLVLVLISAATLDLGALEVQQAGDRAHFDAGRIANREP
jgi:hypothetical protein